MSDVPPDRLSNNPKSPFYDEALLRRGVGIRFKGAERTNVEEYCVSEGWIRVAVGKTLDRHGNPLTMKASGPVEPYFAMLRRARRSPAYQTRARSSPDAWPSLPGPCTRTSPSLSTR